MVTLLGFGCPQTWHSTFDVRGSLTRTTTWQASHRNLRCESPSSRPLRDFHSPIRYDTYSSSHVSRKSLNGKTLRNTDSRPTPMFRSSGSRSIWRKSSYDCLCTSIRFGRGRNLRIFPKSWRSLRSVEAFRSLIGLCSNQDCGRLERKRHDPQRCEPLGKPGGHDARAPRTQPSGTGYLISTFAPASSNFFLIVAASSLETDSLMTPRFSTRSLASLRPSEGLTSRTALMTLILAEPASLRTTVNSVCSSTAAAAAAGAAIMAAETPNFSSRAFTSVLSSRTDIDSISVTNCSTERAISFLLDSSRHP